MRATITLALLLAAPAAAQPGRAPFTVAETGQGFASLQQAVTAVGDGDATIVVAPGTYRDCASQRGGRITFRAATPGTAVFDGGACEGKATLVLGGRASRVDGLVFRNIRVPDGNGAGIRTEAGDLEVVNAMFLDSQEGILGAQDAPQKITIDRSTFAGLGQCDETPDCAHSVYLGNQGQITITNSRFERGRGGHYVKLRTPDVVITDNSFDDTAGAKTNYMIDLSEGGTGLIARNTFVQGRAKENWSALIAVSAESRTFGAKGLRIEDNDARLSPGDTRRPAFVANASHQQLALGANRLGPGIKPYEAR
jgi:hypothetical protein